jgi:ankyrin repeat protein
MVHCFFTQSHHPRHTAHCPPWERQQCLVYILLIMSLADLPPELVLHVAAALRDTRDISALMRANRGLYRWLKKDLYQYNIDHENSSGLLRAGKKGNMSAICFFLGLPGVNLHARDGAGETVLHLAAKRHNAFSTMMLLLRDSRVDINALDPYGWSPLSFAVRRGNRAAVRWLLESGADRGIEHNGVTLLSMAYVLTRRNNRKSVGNEQPQ